MSNELTKGQINRVGKILKDDGVIDDKSKEVLKNFREIHQYPLHLFRNTIDRKLTKLAIRKNSYLVSQRLKRISSIICKLKIQHSMELARMNDVAGLRVVVGSVKEVYSLREEFIKLASHGKFTFTLIGKGKDYISNPKDSGYMGIHLIYKYEKNIPKESQCLIEIQIRSKIQHSWATAVEVLGTYKKEALKQSIGEKKILELLKNISICFRFFEGDDIDKYILENTVNDINEYNLIQILEGFGIITQHISNSYAGGEYVLIESNFEENTIEVTKYRANKFKKANDHYLSLELENIKNKSIEVVLVSVKNIKKLQQSYPNYFMDTVEFIKNLNKLHKLNNEFQKVGKIDKDTQIAFLEIINSTIKNN